MAVSFAAEDGIGYITLDKPPANSYDRAFMEEMSAAVDAAAADDAAKAVIVRSASKRFFCAGADIKAFLANDTAGNMAMIELGHEVLARIATVPKVFIAQLEGHALGGGLEISLACDLRFGARGSYKLGVPEVTLGLLPGNGGTQRLTRLVGPSRALELLVTGRTFSVEEGREMGLIADVYDTDEAQDNVSEYAARLAALPALAVAAIKRCVHEGGQETLADGLALEAELMEQLFRSEDAAEGLKAFVEKRKPQFVGR